MPLVFETQFEKGSLNDRFGGIPTNTGNTQVVRSGGRLSPNFSGSQDLNYSNILSGRLNGIAGATIPASFSMVIYVNPSNLTEDLSGVSLGLNSIRLMVRPGSSAWGFQFIGGKLIIYSNTIVYNKPQVVIVNWDSDTKNVQFFIDGVSSGGLQSITRTNIDTSAFTFQTHIGNAQGYLTGAIYKMKVYSHILSYNEIQQEQAQFLAMKIIDKPKRGFKYLPPTDLGSEINKKLSANIVTNGDFSTWTGTFPNEVPTGWTIFGTPNANSYIANSSNGCRIVSTGIGIGIQQTILTVGKQYKVTFDVLETNGTWEVDLGTTYGGASGTGKFSFVGLCAGSGTFTIKRGAACDVLIDNIVVQEYSGLVAAYNMVPTQNKLIDISGNNADLTNTNVITSNNGTLYNGVNSKSITAAAISSLDVTKSYTVVLRFKPNDVTTEQVLVEGASYATNRHTFSVNGGNLLAGNYDNVNFRGNKSNALIINQWYNLVYSWDAVALTATAYLNGVATTGTSGPAHLGAGNTFSIGMSTNGSAYPFNGEIADCRVYNRIFTSQEAKDYNNIFSKQIIINEDFANNSADGVTINQPNGWVRESGTVKINELSLTKSEIIVNGTFNSGVSSWTATASSNHTILWDNTDGVSALGCMQITSTGVGSDSAKASQQMLNVNTFRTYKMVWWAKSISGNTGLNVYLTGGFVSPVKVCTLTSTWQRFEMNVSAQNSATNIFFNMYMSDAGVCKVDDVSLTEIEPLPSLKQGSKYLEAVTTTEMSIPCQSAYGTIEFDLFKGADADAIEIRPISSCYGAAPINGYRMQFTAAETIVLQKYTASSPSSISWSTYSGLAFATWYRFRITRTNSGLFQILIRGGYLIPTSGYDGWTNAGTATDNTFTTSNYFNVELPAGCGIANIKISNGIIAL